MCRLPFGVAVAAATVLPSLRVTRRHRTPSFRDRTVRALFWESKIVLYHFLLDVIVSRFILNVGDMLLNYPTRFLLFDIVHVIDDLMIGV